MEKTNLSVGCALIVILAPLAEIILNLTDTQSYISYRVWIMFLFIPAVFGLLIAIKDFSFKKIYKPPFIMLIAFGIWSIFCAAISDTPFMCFFGFVPMSDCVSVYLSYFAMILIGIMMSEDKESVVLMGKIYVILASVFAAISLMDNGITYQLFANEATNCFHYQGPFYNTNHCGYYLTIALILCGYMIEYLKSKREKIIYAVCFILLTNMLILNNTMGSYLAVLLTFFFAVIWSFINRENKLKPALVFVAFVALSAISLIYTSNVIDNFTSMFSDVGTVIDSSADIEEVASVGSARGGLWKLALKAIKISPIVGFGPQGIGFSAHNMYLQIGMYTGIPGLAMYLAFLVLGVIRLIKLRNKISPITRACAFAVVGYLISGFFGLTLFYTAPYFYIVLGVCLGGCIIERPQGDNASRSF